MTKLDDILDRLEDRYGDKVPEAKQQIKDLFMELIGEDSGALTGGDYWRDREKLTLRQKVSEL